MSTARAHYPAGLLLCGALAIAGSGSGCTDVTSVEDSSTSRTADVGRASAPRTSAFDPAAENAALRDLTRAVALAMQNDGLRRRVGTDMGKSRVREHKLELARYLRGNGGELLAMMSRESGLDRDALAGLLAKVRPLEFYMPVRAHRGKWTGDANLLVAATLDDTSIVAFDLDGRPVSLSISEPPATPTLALVPVETDFAAAEAVTTNTARMTPEAATPSSPTLAAFDTVDATCDPTTAIIPCDDGGGTVGGGLGPYPPGIYFSSLNIRDVHEPWLRGDPEIDMVFAGFVNGDWVPTAYDTINRRWIETYDPNVRRLVYTDCAGGNASGYRWFDANNTGTYAGFYNTLFAQTENFAAVEEVFDQTHSIVIRRRQVQLQPPYYAVLMERDDGHQCPDPPKTYNLDFSVTIRFQGFPIRLERFGWQDVVALFGGNNDNIALFTFSGFDELEGLNNSFRAGLGDADGTFVNHGFNRANIPPPQDPWNGQ